MKDKKKALYRNLQKYSNFADERNIEKFLDTADEIILASYSDAPDQLLKYFDDDSNYPWIFEELSLSVEHLPTEIYVSGLLNNLKDMQVKAVEWAKDMLYPILNDKQCYEYLKKNLIKADTQTLKNLLLKIQSESETHSQQVQEILPLLSKTND